ncbi:PREDICTED: E3 ubiquitin-protein ligase RBBP6-like [Nestor notabilis]|uniref:E3 ubiquitin-protein ligase RBBP6-like n=1 Tax=Nestor notabilis TaxID=176057 RepID=UPI000523D05C|nr:PREDICTED: E3 ubiquitin-protein ligase RBBP6-like [Nestor notabilis]
MCRASKSQFRTLCAEYTDDNALIPKNSSVIVRRIPIGGVKATSKTYVISRTEPVSGTSKAVCKNPISHFFLHTDLNFTQRSPLLIFQTLT